MALDLEVKERLGVLAREMAANQREEQWWQRVRVHDLPPPVPWELIDLTQKVDQTTTSRNERGEDREWL